MPDTKRHQPPKGCFSPLLLLAEKDKPAAKELLKEDGRRMDGRGKVEIRPLYFNLGVNPRAVGSTYMEMGRTKIMCTVYGPKETSRKEVTEEGQFNCDFKFAPFSCTQRRQYQQDQQEKAYSETISQAIMKVLDVKSFPRLQLEVDVLVLENGGSVLSSAITCVSVALTQTGVEMLDIPVACSVSEHTSGFLVDPSVEEEFKGDELLAHPSISGSLMVAYLPSLQEVTAIKQLGHMSPDKLLEGISLCVEGCTRIHQKVRSTLQEKFSSTT